VKYERVEHAKIACQRSETADQTR